jgi:hypothetical protein
VAVLLRQPVPLSLPPRRWRALRAAPRWRARG